jgi:hypothetical protein
VVPVWNLGEFLIGPVLHPASIAFTIEPSLFARFFIFTVLARAIFGYSDGWNYISVIGFSLPHKSGTTNTTFALASTSSAMLLVFMKLTIRFLFQALVALFYSILVVHGVSHRERYPLLNVQYPQSR